MSERHRNIRTILSVNTADSGGGAESTARTLHTEYLKRGLLSTLAVGTTTRTDLERVVAIPNEASRRWISRALLKLSAQFARHGGRGWGAGNVGRGLRWLAEPIRDTRRRLGHEDFHFPGTEKLIQPTPDPIDIVHMHNLHGDYFDLRQLPLISNRVPTAITLHDQWLLTGHCGYSLDCERWREECGSCPYLDVYPAIQRDATRGNLARKRRIYSKSRLYVSAPSQWLLDQIPDSALQDAVHGTPRLIPYGVDQNTFNPSGRSLARSRLEVPEGSAVVTFVGNFALSNFYKDWPTLEQALRIVGSRWLKRIYVFAIGESGTRMQFGNVTIQPVGRVNDPALLADWYRSSDLHVQPSRADNYPLTILESLSCGTPVVGTAVGGIPEQIRPLASTSGTFRGGVPVEQATGALVPVADPEALAQCVTTLLGRPNDLAQMTKNAARDAQERFSLDRYVSNTLDWYGQILEWEAREAPVYGSRLSTGTHP
jgi:glycosyltransferase involved in cell wall biosynthesis